MPGMHDFGSVQVGMASMPQTFTVRNAGGSLSGMPTVNVSGEFQVAMNACNMAVAGNGMCTIQVTFRPTSTGPKSGTLTVSGMPGGSVSASLQGTGVTAPMLSASPTRVMFPDTLVGQMSGVEVVTITNNGGSPVTGLMVPANAGMEFVVGPMGNKCGATLAAGASCTVELIFRPMSAGQKTANLTVMGMGAQPLNIALNGRALAPARLAINPMAANFSAEVGKESDAQPIVVTNTGDAASGPVNVAFGGAAAAEFVIKRPGCAAPLAAGASCTVEVAFRPGSAGMKMAAITATAMPGGMAMANLVGNGVMVLKPAELAINPNTGSFGSIPINTTSMEQTFTVTNGGEQPSGMLSASVVGLSASQFQIGMNTCNAALMPMGTCTVTVRFAPTTVGDKIAMLQVSGTPGGSAVANLTGSGVMGPAFTFNPNVAPAGWANPGVVVGQTSMGTTVTITNTGMSASGMLAIATTGAEKDDFVISNNTCVMLAPGESCVLTLAFKPAAAGLRNGSLTVTGGGQTASLTLQGTGLGLLQVRNNGTFTTPATRDFGSVSVGSTSTPAMPPFVVDIRGNVGNLTAQVTTGALDFINPTLANCASNLGAGAPTTDFSGVNPTDPTTWVRCTLQVSFAPKDPRGAKAGVVTVSAAGGQSDTATLTGTAVGPLQITPNPALFGTVGVGATGTVTLTVANNGSVALNNLVVTLSGAEFAKTVDNCSGTNLAVAAPPATCTITITLTPISEGAKMGSVTVTGTLAGSATMESETVVLTGTGGTPSMVTISPTSLTFGDVAAGGQSATQTVTITNSGQSPTGQIAPAPLGGNHPGDFTVLNNCIGGSAVLGPGASCTMTVQFTPAANASGGRSAILTINNGGLAAGTVSLAGNAVNALAITPSTQDFGATAAGDQVSGQQVVFTVTNNAAGILTVGASGVEAGTGSNPQAANWAPVANTCTGQINPGVQCQITVKFAPLAGSPLGVSTAIVRVAGTVGGQAAEVSATISGTVLRDAELEYKYVTGAETRNFGGVQIATTRSVTFTVRNVGGVPTSGLTRTLTLGGGTNVGEFTLGGTCTDNASLPANGGECTVIINFAPGSAGAKSATLVVSALPRGGTAPTLTFNGTGVMVPALVIDPAAGNEIAGNFAEGGAVGMGNTVTPVPSTFTLRAVGAAVNGITISRALAGATGGMLGSVNSWVLTGDGTGGTCNTGAAFNLTANGSCTFTVALDPLAGDTPGYVAATITATDGGANTATAGVFSRVLLDATFQVTDPNGGIAAAPPGYRFHFGKVVSGNQSETRTFVVRNVGERASGPTAVNVTGNFTLDPTITSYCNGMTVAVNGTCNVGVRFAPQSVADPLDGTFTLTATPLTGSPVTIGLRGTGATSATVTVTPTNHTFADTVLGRAQYQDFVVANPMATAVDTGTLTFSLTGSGEYAIVTEVGAAQPNAAGAAPGGLGFCNTTTKLQGGENCTIRVKWIPASVATATAILSVNATPGNPVNAAIAGTGLASLSFGGGSQNSPNLAAMATHNFVVNLDTNAGPTGALSVMLGGTDAALFTITNNGCATAGQLDNDPSPTYPNTCTVTVRFTPGANVGMRTATLTVRGTAPGNEIVGTLTGTN